MYIANPIYDVVFKYMMEDNKVAKKFISTIIGEQIEEMEYAPQEATVDLFDKKEAPMNYTVCRIDFLAKITTETGLKTVIIEVQKAKMPTDIMRFRRYLGAQYEAENNSYKEGRQTKARQIYCIFFLGDKLGVDGVPVIEINHKAKDRTTNEELPDLHNEFIDSLHHRSWIVQVPELPQRRRNEIEILLSVFDQSYSTSVNSHILNILEMDFPEEFRPVIRRLQQALESQDIKNKMIAEDDLIEYLQDTERLVEEQKTKIEEKDKALEEKDKTIEEKDKVIEEKDKAIEEKDQVIEEKDKAIEEKDKAFEEMRKALAEKDKAFEEMRKVLDKLLIEVADLKQQAKQ